MENRIKIDQLKQLRDGLEDAGIEGSYSDQAKEISGHPGEIGNVNCRGCWGIIPGRHLMKRHRYCKRCMKTRNNLGDYRKIFLEITSWMENFVKLIDCYPLKMGWNQSRFGGDPARVRGVLNKRHIVVRPRVKRDEIPKYLVYCYMELWMSERDQHDRMHAELCVDFLREKGWGIDHRIISGWYMIQYMRTKGEIDEAARGEKLIEKEIGNSWRSLTAEYAFWEPSGKDDDRKELERMLERHPVKDILGV